MASPQTQTVSAARAASGSLTAAVVRVTKLSPADKARMFELMRQSYDAVTEQQFLFDLGQKDDVILLRDRGDEIIRGFSTLARLRARWGRQTLRGVFSGDTVIEPQYWGRRTLGKAFLKFMWWQKLRHPASPLYWLLISKGYKTYLMMANNFSEHYPRCERPTPADKQAIIEAFYTTLFPKEYDPRTGLVRFGAAACRLKAGVAGISPELAQSNRRVAFFQQVNPDWTRGVELACLARMTWWMPLAYWLKVTLGDRWLGLPVRLRRLARDVWLAAQRRSRAHE